MTDLRTRYLGLDLRTPLVASSSPLTGELDSLRRLEDGGVAAVVLPSLFEEQLAGARPVALDEARLPERALRLYNGGLDDYLDLVAEAKRALAIPVIASLNGVTVDGWPLRAGLIEGAGADTLEVNAYFIATNPEVSAGHIEQDYLRLVAAMREATTLPLAIKIGPYFTALARTAREMVAAGADGLVLFNRFYQPDIDLHTGLPVSHLELSTSHEIRVALRWLAVLHGKFDASLAASGGFHTADDVAKGLLVGADVVTVASALLRHGPAWIGQIEHALCDWMAQRGHDSLADFRGTLSHSVVADPAAYERALYVRTLVDGAATFAVG